MIEYADVYYGSSCGYISSSVGVHVCAYKWNPWSDVGVIRAFIYYCIQHFLLALNRETDLATSFRDLLFAFKELKQYLYDCMASISSVSPAINIICHLCQVIIIKRNKDSFNKSIIKFIIIFWLILFFLYW